MNLQAITTDMGEAVKYSGGAAKKGMKMSEILRRERERLFPPSKELKIIEVTKKKKISLTDYAKVYKLKPKTLRQYGRKVGKKELRMPKYGRITNIRFIKHTPEHNARIDAMVQTVITEFSEAFAVPECDLREHKKNYHATRVRTLVLGFIYAHIHMDPEDVKRNFQLTDYSNFRDRYRQMQYLIERVFFARPFQKIYKKLRKQMDYDYDKTGTQFAVNRSIVRYSRRSGRDYKLCKGSKARQMVGRAEA